jgi:hypothetical protein
MLQRVLAFGLLGPLVLIGGCTFEQSASNFSAAGAAAKVAPPTEQKAAHNSVLTKDVNLSVPGMT